MTKPPKRQNGQSAMEEVLSAATDKVLKQILELYESGLSSGQPGSMGLKAIAEDPLLALPMLKPRKKISVMIVGNHSAGKSSFINWYIGETIQKTGVAIETRGFTFLTSGKKRETLTGDATIRFYDYLKDFCKFDGIIPNLFTEITPSKDKNFSCVDFIDTPGLVDGDMQYPFNVQNAILWMAEHVDLVLIFLDPIGQATCKRTMEVVERLNNSPHLEKIHYFMSKADAVEKEHDRQRVLIQITQNLATRIRNSHAFNLPTFYLPREDECSIPNAIEDVCKEIDKSINMTVQKNLKNLNSDCQRIEKRVEQVIQQDKDTKLENRRRRIRGSSLTLATALLAAFTLAVIITALMDTFCTEKMFLQQCESLAVSRAMMRVQPIVEEHFWRLLGICSGITFVTGIAAALTWRTRPVLTKRDYKKLADYKATVQKIALQEQGLYDEYFKTLSTMEH
uniref:Dynamin N-terminal domain-containing protein n=1 Tax=Polytomella parva TaxID=51329 RepID=A0A7S0UNL7_9CHLO|mmetsp:Transcript_12413/g.22218  ORF Transcript_12413/g.22218 Transcript_12413/m.22218 type:complete len:452 (+) Transcript_12413:44-1399(+)